jgi:hypothetical protein
MSGYGQMQRAPAQQKTAYSGSADHRTAVGDRAPATEPLSQSLNQSSRAQSLLQMRQALDEGPCVQSQLALQRALNRTRAPQANEGEQPEQDARSEPAQLAAMPDADPLPAPVQKKPNATGLPDRLKAGVEQLSGLALDDVRVHTNSSKPAAVQAHAYAQGTDIHVAPGQEKHLPHEAWHVVQQKQGRVKPTLQMKRVAINDDAGLEREADTMGRQALDAASAENSKPARQFRLKPSGEHDPAQTPHGTFDEDVVQRVVTAIMQKTSKLCWAAVGYAIHLHKGGDSYEQSGTVAVRNFVVKRGKDDLWKNYDLNKVADIDDIIGSASKNNLLSEEDSVPPFSKDEITKELGADKPIVANVDSEHYIILTGCKEEKKEFNVTYMEPADGTTKTEKATSAAADAEKIEKVGKYSLTVLYFTS